MKDPLFLLCVLVACHSVKTAMALHARMQAECGLEPGDIKFYHGASDGKQKREDFANATLAWGGDVIAVVPTPSLCSAHACFVLFFFLKRGAALHAQRRLFVFFL